eukprot:2959228-Rhodomonas_salina.1
MPPASSTSSKKVPVPARTESTGIRPPLAMLGWYWEPRVKVICTYEAAPSGLVRTVRFVASLAPDKSPSSSYTATSRRFTYSRNCSPTQRQHRA